MQQISAGDVYYLRSPFKSVNSVIEKRLCYMLGTISQRPVVIIRAPYAWDHSHNVTVIPAMSEQKPSFHFDFYGRYGQKGEYDYSFCPQNVHTIPANRLGRYIGKLTHKELKDLLYAFKWINDPDMQEDPEHYPMPEIYKGYMDTDKWAKQMPTFFPSVDDNNTTGLIIDQDFKISLSDPSNQKNTVLDGAVLDFDPESCIRPEVAKNWTQPPNGNDTKPELVTEDEEIYEDAIEEVEEEKGEIPAYPISVLTDDVMKEHMAGLIIDLKYYQAKTPTRKINVFTREEFDNICGSVTSSVIQQSIDTFGMMYPVDQEIFLYRLPTSKIAKCYKVPMATAACLKRISTAFHEMTEAEYRSRLASLESIHHVTPEDAKRAAFRGKYPKYNNGKEINEAIEKLKPYLIQDRITLVPDNLITYFVRCPVNAVRANYTGKYFEHNYNKAFKSYRDRLLEQDTTT